MTFSVGQRLRQARLEQGLDLDTVVARTKISLKNLKAIEADDRSIFPSGFFYKSFVDQYARALSLETQEIDAEINLLLSADAPLPLPGQVDKPAKNVAPLAMAPRAARARMYASLAVFTLVLAGCSGLYAWWHKIQTPIAAPPPSIVEAAQKSAPAQVVENRPSLPPDLAKASEITKAPEATAVPVSLETAHPEPAITAPPAEAKQPASAIKVLLELVARQETWLAVSSDGRMIFKGTLAPNETKTIEGREFAKLRVTNAAALEVKLNGRRVDPLGAPGQFRVVVFTPDKFQIVEAEKQSD